MVPSPTPPSSFHPAIVVASCQRLSLPLGPCGAGPISAACSPTWTSTQQQPQQCCCSSSSPTPHPCTCFASHMHCQDLPPVANWGSFLICLFWGCEFEWIIGDLWSSFGVAGWGVLGVMIVGTMGQPLQVLLRATPPPPTWAPEPAMCQSRPQSDLYGHLGLTMPLHGRRYTVTLYQHFGKPDLFCYHDMQSILGRGHEWAFLRANTTGLSRVGG
jgi:hypothetical protein